MALDYAQSAALMQDTAFRERVKVGCMKYADYIVAEAANVPAHNTRYRWAQATMLSPDSAAQTIMPTVVMQDQVQQQGAAISDADLQTVVEVSVNKLM